MEEELDPLIAATIYDDDGNLNAYAQQMKEQFPDVDPVDFGHLRFGTEHNGTALLGAMENHFGAFEYARMETALEKYLANADTQPVPLPTTPDVDTSEEPVTGPQVDLASMQQESNTERFKDKALEVAAKIPSQLLNAAGDFGNDVITSPVTTVTGTVENAGKMASGVLNTAVDAPDVANYAYRRLDMGLANAVARGVGAVGNEGDARNKGWERIFSWQRAIDAIPGPALMMAGTGVRLPINSEDDLEFYKSLGINPRNAKVGGHMDRYLNITKLDQIAEHFGTTAEQMVITGGEAAVKSTLTEVDTALGALIGDAAALMTMSVMTGGGNMAVRAIKDGAVEGMSYTDSDPGTSETVLRMAGFDDSNIPEFLQVQGKQDLGSIAVRSVEGGLTSVAIEAFGGFIGKLTRKEIPDQEVLKKTIDETHTVIKEATEAAEEVAQAAAKAAQEAVDEFDAAVPKVDVKPAEGAQVSPKTLEITSNIENIAEDIATGRPLQSLDDASIDALTQVRDFKNYGFFETVGKTTAAIKTNLENAMEVAPTSVNDIINKADVALKKLRKDYGDGALPKWALEEINTGSQAADVLARVVSIKTVNDQIERLSKYISTGSDDALGGLKWIKNAENPREVASWYMTKLMEGAEDLNGLYNKTKRDWGQTGVILRKLKQGIEDKETAQNMEQLIKREMDKGYISPDEAAKRIEDFKTANASKLNKYADASEGGLMATLTKSQYSSLLGNHVTMMVNLVSEMKRTIGYATISPIANSIELFRRGQVKKAGLEAGRLLGQFALVPAQMGKVARNVRQVWATGMGNIQRELTPYSASTNKALTLGEVFGERAARETLPGKVAIIPARTIDVAAAVTLRSMATISETIGTLFVGANTDYSTLVGQYGKKWQDRMLKNGFLSPEEVTEMLTEVGGGRRTITGQLIDEDLAETAAAFRFQDNIDGTTMGGMENWYNKTSHQHKVLKWAVPFFGIGVRLLDETLTMQIPGLAFLHKGPYRSIAAKRMGLGEFAGPVTTPSQRAWRYYYGAMQVNMMTSLLQGMEDYDSTELGVPPLPEEIGDTTKVFEPVSGKFGEFGGGIVTMERTDKGIRRVEEKSMELMDPTTVSYIWRNLGYHMALLGDEEDAVDTGEAMTRLATSQVNTVLGASVIRTLPAEFGKLTGQSGGKGIYDWFLGKLGAQVALGSGYRNMKKVWKEYMGDPTYLKAHFEDGVLPYSAERLSWIGDLGKVMFPSWFVAANKDLGFAGYPNSKGHRGNIDPTTKVSELPVSVVIANWVSQQQGRKMIREEWTVPGTEVLLRDIEGPSGFSLFTDVVERSNTVEMPHPVDGRMMTMTDYMDGELDNPQSQLRRDLASRGIYGEQILEILENMKLEDEDKDYVAALEGGNVIWEFIKDTQKRYNDMALAELIHGLPKKDKEELLQQVEMTTPQFWYDQFPVEVKARLNLIDKGEGTVIDGEFRLYEEGQ